MMTIDELKKVQSDRNLSDVHVVELRADGFTLAHTDRERAAGRPLTDCSLHRFLVALGAPPRVPGLYTVPAYEYNGETFRAFEPLRSV